MELRIAILGGVFPGLLVAIAMVVGAVVGRWFDRRGARGVEGPAPSGALPGGPVGSDRASRRTPAPLSPRVGVAWLLGAIPAAFLVHFTSWSWPEVWPTDATKRLLHAMLVLIAWGFAEVAVPRATPRSLRTVGRAAQAAAIVGILAHAYLGVLGWGRVIGLSAGAGALTALVVPAMASGSRRRHPSLPHASLFIACLGAMAVLLIGRTATGAQAAAGIAALSAATGVASLLARRATPLVVGPVVLVGSLCWVLAMGACASEHVNWAAIAILPLAPIAWGVPLDRLPIVRSRAWLRPLPAVVWTILVVGSAVLIAWLDRPATFDDYP
ncbi:MAG: hypothetical protein KDA05_09670 [Phycisphaerales bacterium]|nr:hypothetical protein [Phycisphaerales bacterium]